MPRTPPRRERRRENHRDRDRDGADRRRISHRQTNSATHLLDSLDYSSNSPSPTKPLPARHSRRTSRVSEPLTSRSASSNPLSAEGLARLTATTAGAGWNAPRVDDREEVWEIEERRRREREYEEERWRRKEAERERRRKARSRDVEDSTERRRRQRESEADVYESEYRERRRSRRRDSVDYVEETREHRRREVSRDYPRDRQRTSREAYRSESRQPVYASDDGIRVYDEVRVSKSPNKSKDDRGSKAQILREYEEKKERERLKAEKQKTRVISGPLAEEGGIFKEKQVEPTLLSSNQSSTGWGFLRAAERRSNLGTVLSEGEIAFRRKRRKRICIYVTIILLILIIAISVGVGVSKHKNNDPESQAMKNSTTPSNSNLDGISKDDIPADAKGSVLDPFTWYDTTDFNVTYTDAMVGNLSMMGLNSTWDDGVRANDNVPALKDAFGYGKMPIRGVNIGGWLSIEPFITPSFFSSYGSRDNVIDEYTLCTKLGPAKAKTTLEKHYASFVTRETFVDIRNAGFDHVRIPFSYWAVTTYANDPYVPQISWRYLLRGIEWARQNGLRVNLDLHGAPGSQNGWNHSGRQGAIGWLNGTDGDLNAQRTLDIHNQLSTFFAQPRYKNVVTMYGLLNEPRMVAINTDSVINWTKKAIDLVQGNNITAIIVFGDGFMGLDNWQGKLTGYKNILLDVHQYVIFNTDLIVKDHKDKMNFACAGWTAQMLRSQNTATGFGPTMCGEWSQADTDCATNLNNVGVGSRWEGTMNTGNSSTSVLDPTCPTKNSPRCDCSNANKDPSQYSDVYKQWLLQFAQAQMVSFESGWGWFYWTWVTENAPQWSYKDGLKAGILPDKVWNRNGVCNTTSWNIPDYSSLGLPEYY